MGVRLALPTPAAAALVLTTALGAPGTAGQEQPRDTVPAYMERIEQSRRTGRGITLTRTDLDSLNVRTLGRAVDRVVTGGFRTEAGARCRPAVYWNGIQALARWDRRSVEAETPLDRVRAIEIYFADRDGRLPLQYLDHECGVIAVWADTATGEETATTVGRLFLVILAGVAFFVLVGT